MINLGVVVVLLMASLQVSFASECNKCQENRVSCESESEYYICMGDKRLGPYYCEADEVCTNSDNVCENREDVKGDIVNVCGENNGKCQACTEGKQFTCASKTQFALCSGAEMNENTVFDCDDDEICVTEAEVPFKTVCVPQCAADYAKLNASCSNDVYTPPTQAPPTTPNPTEIQTICSAAPAAKTKRFFYAYVDSTCRTYVYCEKNALSSSYFETTFTGSCPSPNIYFNTANGKCQSTIPEKCRTDAPTTTAAPTTPTTPAPPATPTEPSDAPPATSDAPPATSDAPPATSDAPPATSNAPPTTSNAPPATSNAPPATSDAPPTTSDNPPTSSDEPSTSSDEPPTSSDDPPTSEDTTTSPDQ